MIEINIDGIVGPSYYFSGAGVGNVASHESRQSPSYPRAAALEGLEKAHRVSQLGIGQYVLPPPLRPRAEFLEAIGFDGGWSDQTAAALQCEPSALAAVYSSAFIWTANAATYAPACDTIDGVSRIVPANLISSWHRASEAAERSEEFRQLFAQVADLRIEDPLPAILPLRDEGAANHMRLSLSSCHARTYTPVETSGLHVFVYGESTSTTAPRPSRFLARQTESACRALARRLRLHPENTFYLQQHPQAVDAGVFHNDVIATAHESVMLHHELAFINADVELARIESRFRERYGRDLQRIVIRAQELPLVEAVKSYFFNCQILSDPQSDATSEGTSRESSRMTVLFPKQCTQWKSASETAARLLNDRTNPIERIEFVDLFQSMGGGGGPACLRLRIQLTEQQVAALDARFRLTEQLYSRLRCIIEDCYPDRLTVEDLLRPGTRENCEAASRRVGECFTA
ncbi:MAG: N-succinylarginine dihydrolase [Pirellulales bacterium]